MLASAYHCRFGRCRLISRLSIGSARLGERNPVYVQIDPQLSNASVTDMDGPYNSRAAGHHPLCRLLAPRRRIVGDGALLDRVYFGICPLRTFSC